MNIKAIRNWLSIIFIIGAIVGMIVYFLNYPSNRETGIYIILGSMIFKFIESALRMTFKND